MGDVLSLYKYHARHAHTPEQRGVAAQLADQMTDWQPPKRDPAKIARQAQAFQPIPPQQYIAEEIPAINGTIVLVCAALIFTLPLALYGAVKFGGEVVHLALGVMP